MRKLALLFSFYFLFTSSLLSQNKINRYEYWFDEEYSSRVTTNISPVKDFALNAEIPVNNLGTGMHRFHIRFRDTNNEYSSLSSSYFIKLDAAQMPQSRKIIAYEFWYDRKYAQKVYRTIAPVTQFSLNTMLDVNALGLGLHNFSIRFLDDKGQWSAAQDHYFYKKETLAGNNMINAYQYWFDDNNGVNNVTTVNIAPVKEKHLLVDINPYPLGMGQHNFHIRFKDIRNNWSSVLTSPFLITTGSPAPVNLVTRIVDPNPTLINANGNIINNPALAANLTTTREGACTDGITKLLLITESAVPVNYKVVRDNLLTSKDGTFGTLASPDQGLNSINISPVNVNGKNLCIAVYTVPDSWDNVEANTASRLAQFHISLIGNPNELVSESIELELPPLLLIHGMWGSRESWTNGGFYSYLATFYGSQRITIFDYSGTKSASSFNPENPNNVVIDDIKNSVTEILNKYRNNKTAVAQIDVVAHSMGGLMAKSFIATSRFIYKTKENFHKGYFHKLITIGTPHKGSPLGPAYFSANLNPFLFVIFNNGIWSSMPLGPCHLEFSTNSNALQNLKNVEVRSHVIVGSHYPDLSSIQFRLFNIVGIFYEVVFTGNDNDFIVPLTSQLGGMPLRNASFYSSVAHSNPFTKERRELYYYQIQERTKHLLWSDDTQLFSSIIPGITKEDKQTPFVQKQNSTIKLSSSTIKIASPDSGTVYSLNQNTMLTLSIDTQKSDVYYNAFFFNKDIGIILIDSPNNSVSMNLSLTTNPGLNKFYLIANDIDGNIMIDSTTISFILESSIADFLVTPPNVTLDSINNYTSFFVSGTYFQGDTSSILNLTNESTGTSYSAQNGEQIVSVQNGVVKAKAVGTDTITVRFEDNVVKVPVTVTSIGTTTNINNDQKFGNSDNEIQDVIVYPNPFSDYINVEYYLTKNTNVNLSVYNVLGQKVYEQIKNEKVGLQKTKIKLSNIPLGIYVYKIQTNDFSVSGKIIRSGY